MSEPIPPAAERPKSWAERLGPALPVALAAIATTFAGMSSSEMARAMFWRSAAAQDQAKAASQWTLAGFKRDRALIAGAAAANLRATVNTTLPAPVKTSEGYRWLAGFGPSKVAPQEIDDPKIQAVLDAILRHDPDEVVLPLAALVSFPAINKAIRDAELADDAADRLWKPTLEDADQLASTISPPAVGQAARFDLDARRYRMEVKLNQAISQVYEVRVRVTTAESDRHRKRSENFFYAMLVGQLGATGSALALGRQRKSALWSLAGLAGLVAVGFGGYVYLTM